MTENQLRTLAGLDLCTCAECRAESYAPPPAYQEGLALLRAAGATSERDFEDRYKRERLAALAAEHDRLAATPTPRLTAAEEAEMVTNYGAPDIYAAPLRKMKEAL
jgi:hypothetical protein